ncbi:hypothetical protein [Mycolicibacterium fluoranthenivorans]|uniref:SRPBCC family protein n=1 Tax=Mycolicibacterium fluoranthenivorans TaxID=258505 RepID=A0A7X5U3W8_9MYCO|nr:hypothetical protein [Mycolicibacterium fluoranthenivorans]MCV7356129.1 hypothetical protein [Mycolicibacterium fluoranthenivorans]NIH97953.1 hypothetical protein [Mycolicibacterium fluoranthenivorans]
MQRVHVETILPTDADEVWRAMHYPVTFLYVCRGLFGMPALAGRSAPLRVGERGSGWLFVFHLFPAYRHTLEILGADEATRTITTHEYGGVLKAWNHTLHVEPLSENRCRYSDTVDIDAGALTPVMVRVARGLFAYRQWRWRRLVARHLTSEPVS